MLQPQRFFFYLLVYLGLLTSNIAYAEKTIQSNTLPMAQIPEWVDQSINGRHQEAELSDLSDGNYNRLYDQQVYVPKVGKVEYFYHHEIEITNQEGLENASQISVDFSPEFETLTFHELSIVRNDKTLNQQDLVQYKIMQREEDIDNLMYDGRNTAHVIFNDVRVGDILKYSYSTTGDNPIYNGIFSYFSDLEWSVPVGRQHLRIVWNKHTPLHHKFIGGEFKLTTKKSRFGQEYIINRTKTPIVLSDSEKPSWYAQWASVQFSELSSWGDVVNWALPLYKPAYSEYPATENAKKSILLQAKNDSEKISQALQVIQNDIRYLGLEMGVNSHKPSSPQETWQRRWGDCKDKTVALVSLLHALNIEAYPALINTRQKRSLDNYLPSINTFDHVIAAVKYNNETVYLDPTMRYQSGTLPNIYQPQYERALVIKEGQQSLSVLPKKQARLKERITNAFFIPSDLKSPISYTVNTVYLGRSAEYKRSQLASESIGSLQNTYLDFYAYYYPGIELAEPFEILDKAAENIITITEKYTIKNIWEYDENNQRDEVTFYFPSMMEHFNKPEKIKRSAPWRRQSNEYSSSDLILEFESDNWSFNDEDIDLNNDFFEFDFKSRFDPSKTKLTISTNYTGLIDHIPAQDISRYMVERDKANNLLSYGIYMNRPSNSIEAGAQPDASASSFDWKQFDSTIIIFVVTATLWFIAFFIWLIFTRITPTSARTNFYAVSPFKFIFLDIITLGFYQMYWFYRNWQYIKLRDNTDSSPFWRAFFLAFWYIPFALRILTDEKPAPGANLTMLKFAAWISGGIYLICQIISNRGDYILVTTLLIVLCMLPLVIRVASLARHVGEGTGEYALKPKFAYFLALPFAIYIYLLAFGSDLSLIPADSIVSGDKIPKHHLRYLQRKKAIPADEKVIEFYSAAMLDFREDGNGYTNHTVFSYWKEDGKLNINRANFIDVKDIEVQQSNSFTDDTIVNIIKDNGDEFLLYLSTTKDKDKSFVRNLKANWRQQRHTD